MVPTDDHARSVNDRDDRKVKDGAKMSVKSPSCVKTWVRSGPNAVPKNGLPFEVDRTSSLLTSANHPKAVVYLRGAERRCLATSRLGQPS